MGEKPFLQGKYPDLPRSPEVKSAVARQEVRTDERVKGDQDSQIEAYLNRLQEIFATPDQTQRERRIGILKDKLYDSFIIKPEEVPEAYFDLQKRIAREQGHGDVWIDGGMKKEMIDTIITDQEKSLDSWIDYLGSEDAFYPDWFKYFVFRSITQLSEYDKENKRFKNRSKGTTGIFPDINREALAYVADELIKKQKKEPSSQTDEEWQKLLQGANFAKMYAYAIEKITPASQEQKEVIDGQWVKYDQGSNRYLDLAKSLQGHGTDWCTAGESTAKAQLEVGDFYVYYTKDQQGQYSVPRIAIRMGKNQIAEVRGINHKQNLEGNMISIAEEKMATLPGAEKYKKRTADMKKMTEIENKVKQSQELTKEDLRFLYEFDDKIEGFGHERDPRIEEIKNKRNLKNDLGIIFNIPPDRISTTIEESFKDDIVFHYGDISLKFLHHIEELEFPEQFDVDLNLSGLESFKKLKLPKHVCGNVDLSRLKSVDRLELPEDIDGNLDLAFLASAKELKLPKRVNGNLYLHRLTNVDGLELPDYIGGDLHIGLESAKGLKLPEHIHGTLHLDRLLDAKDLKLPETISYGLSLNSLESAEGLKLPEHVDGPLSLNALESAKGLKLPEHVGGDLRLDDLYGIDGLKFPDYVGGSLELRKIRHIFSDDEIKLPKYVGGNLTLMDLQEADYGLKFPDYVGATLNLEQIASAEGLHLPAVIGHTLDLSSLKDPKGLILPRHIGWELDLKRLTSAEGLKPQYVKFGIKFSSLTHIKGLDLSQYEGGTINIVGHKIPKDELEEFKNQYPHIKFRESWHQQID
jgi:hypothetical protein